MKFHVNLKFKDLIFILLIFFFFFLFKQNIFALSSEFDPSYHGSIKLDDYYSFYSSNQNIINNDNALKEWFNSQSEFTAYYHFISPHSFSNLNNYDERYLFVKNNDYQYVFIRPYLYDSYYNTYSVDVRDSSFGINYSYAYCYNISFNNCILTNTTSSGSLISPFNNSNRDNGLLLLFSSSNNLPINRFGSLSNAYMFELNNSYYGIDDNLPSIESFTKPSLTFSNLTSHKNNLQNIYKYTVTLNYTVFDTSLYSYQYLLPNSSTWQNVISNNFLFELYENGSYNFRVVDNSTNEVVSRNVLTVDDITESVPFIDYTIEQIGSCLVPFNNSELEICRRLTLIPSRYDSSYKFQYSLDNGTTWQELYSDYRFIVEKSDIVPLRVLDSSDNLIWSDTLSFDYLDSIDSSLGITIVYNDTSNGLSENEEFFTQIYIYNLDFDYRNNVYISYDGGFNFELLSLERASSYYLGISKNYLSNIIINIKILDSNDNVIFTSSHQVKINNKDNKDFLSYIESFNRSMTGPISSFITSPLRLVNMINNSTTCVPLTFNINHLGDVSLPCLTNEIHSHMPDFLNIYQLLTTGLIGYYCGLTIIKTIKTLVRPDDDRIEVVNL